MDLAVASLLLSDLDFESDFDFDLLRESDLDFDRDLDLEREADLDSEAARDEDVNEAAAADVLAVAAWEGQGSAVGRCVWRGGELAERGAYWSS